MSTVHMDVALKVGSSAETVGQVQADTLPEFYASLAALLRRVADEIERTWPEAVGLRESGNGDCTAVINADGYGTVRCVLQAGHHDPEHGPAHAGPGERPTRLRWFDHAPGAVPHRGGGSGG
ncbi:hypothetical protein E4N62_46845 [Streptomyces sp. MNU76]|uniref:hypothetical protein n=1 Tax=Streptomyces sp. MNU76 TaxID=2560026 RepID=UPI001E28DBFD|nr:hypothetical protein [Streptomyces sp. MNU76]MCC9712076.1 hypothetical protein [Streptomyces sp. MNU76]